jgi:biotin operon repressor
MRAKDLEPAMSLQEIADETGMSPAAVRMLISRALKKLRSEGLLLTAKELAKDLDRNRRGCTQ